jgi:acyl CoA:acetate/3-ketoacid CoA transferase beta subunit
MRGFQFRDEDLVLTTSLTCGELFPSLATTDAVTTVFVVGLPLEREQRMGLNELIRAAGDNVRVILTMPGLVEPELLERPTVSVSAIPITDYPRAMERLADEAGRTIGVFETTPVENGEVTPGAFGLGISTITDLADVLVAEENHLAPRLNGLSVPADEFDHRVSVDYTLPHVDAGTVGKTARRLATNVEKVLPDGATIQLGVGDIPMAVARCLDGRENLGLHSGVVGPGVRELILEGVITRGSVLAKRNRACQFERPGLTTVVLGDSMDCYDWFEAEGVVSLGPIARTHDPALVNRNPRFTAINQALEVDVLGQVNAERVNGRRISAPGGQPAFVRAAKESPGGRSITMLKSTHDGASTVRTQLSEGSVVTVPQYDSDVIVTEHGYADIRRTSASERVEQFLATVSPDHRGALERELRRTSRN